LRKDSGLEVTDRILLKVDTNSFIQEVIRANQEYVCNKVLANTISFESLGAGALLTNLETEADSRIELVKN